ncbi:tetrahydromethanopterin S-methyltransferase subunit C [Methanoplanus sp. FWC-SCC4]|uniref:Tetrahydromethanopterin S-methyltransferase subunit C n=1 Tax=Methanochimaera problematica TaxID=2609417 RepID=A0AA97I2Z2_9EURY|nr:tetrahydromethanopterin S-methyltransferase subunit C [Methanoplanus sp. FWC-SCC4]WOF15341.1 tetrahydromethanopterin S-methyltransferase subunit C [Methanoplanus sp. FWC-SCC4]
MSVEITVSEGGMPHNKVLAIGLVGSLVCIYLTYMNTLANTQLFAFFGGLAAVFALWWGTDTIKHLCSYGLGTGVPSAGMIALGSGVIAMVLATKLSSMNMIPVSSVLIIPIGCVVIGAILGAILGYIANNIVNMNIPVMVVSLAELCIVGAITILGLATMVSGSFAFADLVTGSSTFFGVEVANYQSSVIGGGVIAVIFMLGAIAVQHAFNACLGPNESQDRTLMLAAECGFLSMITVAIMSFAFISFTAAVVSFIISAIGWVYTYKQYLVMSKRDAFMWLDAKPIREKEA